MEIMVVRLTPMDGQLARSGARAAAGPIGNIKEASATITDAMRPRVVMA